ncbi:zinc-ribbon domain-containing protein [Pseudarthrobacter sp. NamE2]|uniref:RDD family protein n=1 Tax=Pseudarthrobacter sp. NamE2 TaxID=2576838 RepID=UPI0010FEFC64|nr:RDD family protein [Pseudarthrobacter sp. NamE2]TLM84841.1 zinc-ribbon domain-containing protein [Pseudarthrobacter sp. NamE2]
MTSDAGRCPRCQQPIRTGAAFCTACGAPLPNRAARSQHAPAIPGTIPVVQMPPAPRAGGITNAGTGLGSAGGSTAQVAAAPGGGTGMATNLQLVPATAGKRLGAAVIDWLPPFAVLVVTFAIGFAGITRTRSGGFITYDTASLVLFGSIGLGFTLVYLCVVMGLEARTGKTPGNLLMGIRSADNDGYAPGAGPVFLRGLVTGAGILLAVVAAVLVAVFQWFGVAFFILGPLLLAGTAWAVLVVVSNSWDKNGRLRGWHDTAAKTLAFDVKAGRNPITTGGIQGPYSFAPLDLPPVQQVLSPVPGAAAPQVVNAQAPAPSAGPVLPVPVVPAAPPGTSAGTMPSRTMPYTSPASFEPPAPARYQGSHADDDVERTQVRPETGGPAPMAVLRIRLDDGRDFQLDRCVLVGRNPVGQAGEQHAQLLAVDDPGRSISKTHLHLLTDGAGIWVTDRNSTNGSAVTTPDGHRTALVPGVPTFVSPGSSVHFGDRTFYLGQA